MHANFYHLYGKITIKTEGMWSATQHEINLNTCGDDGRTTEALTIVGQFGIHDVYMMCKVR